MKRTTRKIYFIHYKTKRKTLWAIYRYENDNGKYSVENARPPNGTDANDYNICVINKLDIRQMEVASECRT